MLNIKQYIHGLILEEIELFKYEHLLNRIRLYEAAVIPPNQNNQQPVQPQGNSTSVQQPQQTQPQPNQPQQLYILLTAISLSLDMHRSALFSLLLLLITADRKSTRLNSSH